MKIRNDFVSNSSSSSFIVNVATSETEYNTNKLTLLSLLDKVNIEYDNDTGRYVKLLPAYEIGETNFDWQHVKYRSIGDKLNFCAIQCYDANLHSNKKVEETEYWQMLVDAIYEATGNITYEFRLNYELCDSSYAYIDHQSSACEGRNIEMFEDDSVLDFLLSNTYIQGGNDNEDYDYED